MQSTVSRAQARQLRHAGLVAPWHVDQGSNSHLPHWQADSSPLSHQGRPSFIYAAWDTLGILIWGVIPFTSSRKFLTIIFSNSTPQRKKKKKPLYYFFIMYFMSLNFLSHISTLLSTVSWVISSDLYPISQLLSLSLSNFLFNLSTEFQF